MPEIPTTVDLTPTPKILRTLGEIPFDAWQCIAELMDNSLDEFRRLGQAAADPRIDIIWSSPSVPPADREIIIADNGGGMQLDALQKAAKAGYSSNDPVGHLGLFGMGFNIATARLGDETIFLSATQDAPSWVGLRINFDELIKAHTFHAPVITLPKENPTDHGTKVIIRALKDGVHAELRSKERSIRQRLETIYSFILNTASVTVTLQGKQLTARRQCTWAATRFVMWGAQRVEAVQDIDRDLGEAYFDQAKNRYLSDDEAAEVDVQTTRTGSPTPNIIKRPRRLRGWVGIQRYCDTSDFGVDFIRNGRKILIGDKRLFEFENPSTGKKAPEYPVELGSTVGGRIVGELHVDYLIPTYQKNEFNTGDKAWKLTIEAVRGAGPILPRQREAFGYNGPNLSPLGKLANAYRRADAGTKYLAAPNSLAKEFAEKFHATDPDFQTDDNWFKAAQEADRERTGEAATTTPVSQGSTPSDTVDNYIQPAPQAPGASPQAQQAQQAAAPPPTTTTRDTLLSSSDKDTTLCGTYSYSTAPGFQVTVRRLRNGDIRTLGERGPCAFFPDGVEIDFVYDPTHPILAEYTITPKQLLLQHLAERFSIRDTGVSLHKAFIGLVENHLKDERINQTILQERARAIWNNITERLPTLLAHRSAEALTTVEQVPADKEKLVQNLLDLPSNTLYDSYRNRDTSIHRVLPYAPRPAILRLVQRFPEEFFDNKLFTFPYTDLPLEDDAMKQRIRQQTVEKLTSYLKDLLLLLDGEARSRYELLRLSNTLALLETRLV